MKTLRQCIGYLIAGILLYFLIKPFLQTHTAVKDATFEIYWGWLLCSFGTILFYWSAYLYPFATLLEGLTGSRVSFRDAFTLFHLANITRYLPGRIWGVVRLLSLSRRFGLSKTAVGSSLTGHVGIETAIGGLIALSLLFSKQMRQIATAVLETFSGQTFLLTVVVMGCLASVVFLIPQLSDHARQFLKTVAPLLGNVRLLANVLTCHCLLWLCQGFAFFLFVRSFAPVQWADVGVLTACFAFAWVVGFLSFLTPGGLGIREGLLGVLLANYMPETQATFLALVCRLWMLSAEILLAVIAFWIDRKMRCPSNT
ncbi:MAG: hypothetical protein OXH00_08480 [Candidatus Poribacteria bacterium]|nr:hypothetical protein [Candidatus Poribacteria bacterium]